MYRQMSEFSELVLSWIGRFNGFDWFAIFVWVVSSGYGLARGLAREGLSILGWVAAFLAANIFAEIVSGHAREIIDDATIRYLAAWAFTFGVILLFFSAISTFLSSQLRQPGFSLGNRLLGGVFGFFRGVIILAAVSILLRAAIPDSEQGLLDNAILLNNIEWIVDWIEANFDQILDSEPTELVKENLDSIDML